MVKILYTEDEVAEENKKIDSMTKNWNIQQPIEEDAQLVKIVGINIPFFQMVWLLTTVAVASIPAAILVMIVWSTLISALISVLAGIR